MGLLRFVQEKSGEYSIIGHNDEMLFVIAELLLNNDVQQSVKVFLLDTERHTLQKDRFHIKKVSNHFIDIKLYKKNEILDEDNPLEIQINDIMLTDLIDAWEDFMLTKPLELVLTRQHDSDMIELKEEPLT